VYEVNPDFISYRGYINVALYVIRVYTVGHVLPVSTVYLHHHVCRWPLYPLSV